MAQQPIGLADTIDHLRKELVEANKRGKGEDLRFHVDGVELELAIEITQEGGAGGKVSFKVLGVGVEGGADASVTRARSNRMTIKLRPDDGTGGYSTTDGVKGRPD